MKSCLIILFIFLFSCRILGQTLDEIEYLNETVNIHNKGTLVFNKAMACWRTKGADYECTMKYLIEFSNIISKLLISNPSYDYHEVKLNAKSFKDTARRYVRFMINCNQNRKWICDENNCMDLAWNMLENIKGLNYRYDILKYLKTQMSENIQDELDMLFLELMIADESMRSEIESSIIHLLPEFKYLAQNKLDISEIQKYLTTQEVFVSFFISDNLRPVYAWKIYKNKKPEVIKLGINSADLFFRIESIKASFENDINYQAFLKSIWNRETEKLQSGKGASPPFFNYGFSVDDNLNAIKKGLVDPLELIPGKKIIFATDQNISALPFDIIPWNEKQQMYELFDISYISSARVFAFVRSRKINDSNFQSFLGLGLGKDLPFTNIEVVNNAMKFINGLAIENATEEEFFKILKPEIYTPDILHIASHTSTITDKFGIKRSCIILNKSKTHDGVLTAKELAENDISNIGLIVLSGCETAPSADIKDFFGVQKKLRKLDASGIETLHNYDVFKWAFSSGCLCSYGETFSNLTSALFALGNQRLLLSQWKIQDKGTALFYERFYTYLKKYKDIHRALRDTKKSMSHLDPKIWAGFIYVGV